jgi:hypothetical protein
MEAAKQLEQITANTITILHNHKKDFNMLVRTVSVSKKLELAIPKSFGGVLFNASADETNSSIEKYEPLLKFIRSSARMEFLWQICKNQTNIFQ